MNKWISVWSTFLFARASAIEGIARAVDLGGTLQEYNYAENTQEADNAALQADWHAIGDDLCQAIAQISEQVSARIDDELIAEAKALLQSAIEQTSPTLLELPQP